MDTSRHLIPKIARSASRWLAPLLFLSAAGCVGLEPADQPAGDVDSIADKLVQNARERADLRQVRVWVTPIRETRLRTTTTRTSPSSSTGPREPAEDVVGLRLEHELVIALATRLNVIESEHDDVLASGNATPAAVPSAESILARGATHLVVGDYVRERDLLQVNLRLVDADSRLIVAAARGAVRLGGITTPSSTTFDRWAWNEEPPRETTTAPPANVKPTVRKAPESARLDLAAAPPAAAAAASSAAPAAASASSGAAAATVAPAAAAPAPVQSAPAPTRSAAPAAAPVEDFESWRKRHQEEQATKTKEELDQAAKTSTAGPVRAVRHELADLEQEASDPFPWRRYPWLAHLLGVPEQSGRIAR